MSATVTCILSNANQSGYGLVSSLVAMQQCHEAKGARGYNK